MDQRVAMRYFVLTHFAAALLFLAGCSGGSEQSALPLPTIPPEPQHGVDLESADEVARRFLDAWGAG